MPKHKQAGQTTVLTKMTANIDKKRLQCRSHPQTSSANTWVLERLPDYKINRIDELMPWNYVTVVVKS